MIGAIIGDLIGSNYEFPEYQDLIKGNINLERRLSVLNKTPKELLHSDCFFSDDTVLTIAIADAVINNVSYESKLKEYGLRYIDLNKGKRNYFESSFSFNFEKWLKSNEQGQSYANGAAMRVSPIGFLFDDLCQVQLEAMKSAIPSHNSAPAITGARAIATTVFLLRERFGKSEIKIYVSETFGYNLDLDIKTLQETNMFNPTCKVTVPQAIFVFLESKSFEDAMKKSLSIGGDTDTIACMVGAMSEACYGIPKEFTDLLFKKNMPSEFFDVLNVAYKGNVPGR